MTAKADGVATGKLHISERLFCEEFCYPHDPDMICLSQGAYNGFGYGVLKLDNCTYSVLDQIVFIWRKNTGYTVYYFQYNFTSDTYSYRCIETYMNDTHRCRVESVLQKQYQAKVHYIDSQTHVCLSIVQWNTQLSAGQVVFSERGRDMNSPIEYTCLVTGVNIPKDVFSLDS